VYKKTFGEYLSAAGTSNSMALSGRSELKDFRMDSNLLKINRKVYCDNVKIPQCHKYLK
jgi:hypothetical protein